MLDSAVHADILHAQHKYPATHRIQLPSYIGAYTVGGGKQLAEAKEKGG